MLRLDFELGFEPGFGLGFETGFELDFGLDFELDFEPDFELGFGPASAFFITASPPLRFLPHRCVSGCKAPG